MDVDDAKNDILKALVSIIWHSVCQYNNSDMPGTSAIHRGPPVRVTASWTLHHRRLLAESVSSADFRIAVISHRRLTEIAPRSTSWLTLSRRNLPTTSRIRFRRIAYVPLDRLSFRHTMTCTIIGSLLNIAWRCQAMSVTRCLRQLFGLPIFARRC